MVDWGKKECVQVLTEERGEGNGHFLREKGEEKGHQKSEVGTRLEMSIGDLNLERKKELG